MITAVRRLFDYLVLEPWQRIDREQRAFLARPESHRFDTKVFIVMLTAAVVMTLQEYLGGNPDVVADLLGWIGLRSSGEQFRAFMNAPEDNALKGHVYWALFSFATYVLPPCVMIKLFGERIRDYGVKPKGAFSDWWIYAFMFGVMVPILFIVSQRESFQHTYPFYKIASDQALWPRFWIWELSYGLQFIGLEFFFRGFMVHGTKHRFGFYSVLAMTVPYCMIHFGKPMPETFGAIVAGLVLGFMSLKTRSIWMGAAIHMSVALSMDFLSMWRQGLFP